MQQVRRELTKEEFERIDALPKKEQLKALFPDGIPIAWECGYGFYGHILYKTEDKYIASFTIGDSCD